MSLSIRKTASVAALFAASVFTSCEKQPTPGPDNGGEPNGNPKTTEWYYDHFSMGGNYSGDPSASVMDFSNSQNNTTHAFSRADLAEITVRRVSQTRMIKDGEKPTYKGSESAHYDADDDIYEALFKNGDVILFLPKQDAKIRLSDVYGSDEEIAELGNKRSDYIQTKKWYHNYHN